MRLNSAMCDYIRMTSYRTKDFDQMWRIWSFFFPRIEVKEANWMQYSGYRSDHGFIGDGMQAHEPHYLMEISGAIAHEAHKDIVRWGWLDVNCTRLDLQVTIDIDRDYSARLLYDRLSGNVPHGRKCQLIQNDDGMDTVYIGSRKTKNGRITRVYVKEYAVGLALRFETEFKGQHAKEHFTNLRNGWPIEAILLLELESLGDLEFWPLDAFYGLCAPGIPAPAPRRVESANPTLQWLLNTCEPVILRMLNDHDHGWKVRHWLESMLDWTP